MSQNVVIELEIPGDLERFKLPQGLHSRLQELLDRQDRGGQLSDAERREAGELVDLAELLSLLQLRARRVWKESQPDR